MLTENEKTIIAEIADIIRKKLNFPNNINDFSLIVTGRADPEHNFETAVSFSKMVLDIDNETLCPHDEALIHELASCFLISKNMATA